MNPNVNLNLISATDNTFNLHVGTGNNPQVDASIDNLDYPDESNVLTGISYGQDMTGSYVPSVSIVVYGMIVGATGTIDTTGGSGGHVIVSVFASGTPGATPTVTLAGVPAGQFIAQATVGGKMYTYHWVADSAGIGVLTYDITIGWASDIYSSYLVVGT